MPAVAQLFPAGWGIFSGPGYYLVIDGYLDSHGNDQRTDDQQQRCYHGIEVPVAFIGVEGDGKTHQRKAEQGYVAHRYFQVADDGAGNLGQLNRAKHLVRATQCKIKPPKHAANQHQGK